MSKNAYVTFIIRNDNFLPGALVFAYGLIKQKTKHDIIAIVSEGFSRESLKALNVLFDDVIELKDIFVQHNQRHQRQDRPFLFSRFHALRLGKDGDLGKAYDKVLVCDADVLPMRYYDDLFELKTPAGIINEKKSYCVEDDDGQYIIPKSVYEKGTWRWHEVYKDYPLNTKIPKEVTDRIHEDQQNMGVNASLYLFEPTITLYNDIQSDLNNAEVQKEVATYPWPEMQYITLKLSGKWHNMDLRYSSFNGYPIIDCLYGIHFAGLKPWQRNHRSIKHFAQFEDYRLWYQVFMQMLKEYPALNNCRKLKKLKYFIHSLFDDESKIFDRKDVKAVKALFR